MNKIMRYIRAFMTALKMTLRGENPPSHQVTETPLTGWVRDMGTLVDALYAVVQSQGIDAAARQNLRLRVDGRDMRLETMLAAMKHHAAQEFPYLLAHPHRQNIMAIQATNINNQYWVSKLQTHDRLQAADIQASLRTLASHLEQMPLPEQTNDQP